MYTISRLHTIDDFDAELAHWLMIESRNVSRMYQDIYFFDYKNFDYLEYARKGLFLVCRRDGVPVGVMLARLFASAFDSNSAILFQDLLYVKPESGRAASLLLKTFIDFGKANANHIFTAKALKTNIKGRSFEKLGFKKVEELFHIEVDK